MIKEESIHFSISMMCRSLTVSISGYYNWLNRKPSSREENNRKLADKIKAIFDDERGRAGAPRIARRLNTEGISVSRHRVARIMRLHGWRARAAKKYKATTNSNHRLPVAPNLFAVYGRQSPYDFSTWFKSGFKLYTEKDNEKKYLSANFHFTAYASGVFFTRTEVDSFLEAANQLINKGTACNMINSNCYSFSVTAMTFAINELLSREVVNASDISRVITLIEGHPLADHCSMGVLNNEIVVNQMSKMLSKIQVQFQPPAGSTHVYSEDESYLYQQSCLLLDRISTEATKYRIPSFIANQFRPY